MTRREHMVTEDAAARAGAAYQEKVARIRATVPQASRAFAEAMTAACREYEEAMRADRGDAFVEMQSRGGK